MRATAPAFDAAQYKRSTRDQWDDAAEAWHQWGPVLETWLGEATEAMLDLAGVREGSRVLDVAAGAGGQTLAAARRVGREGRVLATDFSEGILEHAAAEARAAGLANVAVRAMDAEQLEVSDATFGAVISRLGLMYLPAREAALRGIWRALEPGGRLAAIVFAPAESNAFFSLPVSIIRRRAGLPPPAPGQPGPFILGTPGALEDTYAAAGFDEIEVRRIEAPLRLPAAADCLRLEQESFGALHQMLAGLDDAGRAAAWREVGEALERFEAPTGFVGPCELLVAGGRRPLEG